MRMIFYFSAIMLTFTLQQGGVLAQPNKVLVEQDSVTKFTLSVAKNKMSAMVDGVTLGVVLDEFSRLTGVKVSITEARAKEPVIISFKELSFADGIKKIVEENYTLIMGKSDEKIETPVVTEIKILDRSQADFQNSAENKGDAYDMQELSQTAMDKSVDSIERIKALEDLAIAGRKKQSSELKKVFENALEDENEQIRLAAIEAIQKKGLEVDVDSLRNASVYDESSEIRQMALDEVADRSEPKAAEESLAQAIKNDSDPGVQKFARSMLKELKSRNAWLYKTRN